MLYNIRTILYCTTLRCTMLYNTSLRAALGEANSRFSHVSVFAGLCKATVRRPNRDLQTAAGPGHQETLGARVSS